MRRLRALLSIMLAATALLAVGAASSAAITVTPGGANTASGSITFAGPRIAFRCTASLDESITAGTYAVGDPFGTLTAATLSSCTVPARLVNLPATISFGALGTQMYKAIPIGVLATIAGSNCLWRGTLGAETDGTTVTIDRAQVLVPDTTQALTAPFCATALGNIQAQGTLTLSPGWSVSLP